MKRESGFGERMSKRDCVGGICGCGVGDTKCCVVYPLSEA